MTRAQQRGWEELYPKHGLTLADGPLDMQTSFARIAPLVVEIGFGMGTSLVEMARNEPDKNFVGIEVHKAGVGSALHTSDKIGLSNLRVFCDDAVAVVEQCLSPASVSRFQIYFPDPWHKTKHRKRRLLQSPFVDLLVSRLAPQGLLHVATDWQDYAEQVMGLLSAHTGLNNTAGEHQFIARPDFRPATKFERRGQSLGHGVWDLLFQKNDSVQGAV